MNIWVQVNPRATIDQLGYLIDYISESDERDTAWQLRSKYCGGRHPIDGCTLNTEDLSLHFPGDPVMRPLFLTSVRDEIVAVYECAYVAIIQPDGKFEVSRCD